MKKKMILVTAGNTHVPIDKVRRLVTTIKAHGSIEKAEEIDNIFKGKTGIAIAEYFADQGCDVTVLASNPDLATPRRGLKIVPFNTYDDLFKSMAQLIQQMPFDVVIHSAAVSDYRVGGTYQQIGDKMVELDSSGKIGSEHSELWMKLVPTIKIVDQIRRSWCFRGTLVKFKLQVGMDDGTLVKVAIRSMKYSEADFIVANTLEGLTIKALIISAKGKDPICVSREELPARLYKELEL